MNKETILNIPQVGNTTNTSMASAASEASEDPDPADLEVEEDDGSIGEFDDGRSGKLTLGVLLQEGFIEAGEGVMAIDYLGQTFKGDLMNSGKIKSQETGLIFNNPSAWAIYCKKIVNPSKKSGCGERWASVKYKGRKMDHYKALWCKLKAQRDAEESTNDDEEEKEEEEHVAAEHNSVHRRPAILQHSQLAPKHVLDNTSTLLEVETFQSQGKVQPFTVSMASSSLLTMDLHSHLVSQPVYGYLAGQWDLNAHNLAITHTFPCLPGETEAAIYNSIYSRHLTLAGWYRSCPGCPALPSLKDSESQLDYQVKLLGNSDATYSPCVGVMVSPYTSGASESQVLAYWVVPPPETYPQEYGKPLQMAYTALTDPCLSQETLDVLTRTVQAYQEHPRRVQFTDQFNSDTKFVTKMGRTLLPKFPRDQDERLWRYLRLLILGPQEDEGIDDPLLVRPPLPNGINGGLRSRSSSRRITNEEDEEEIDDDEDNALMNGSNNAPPVPTEDVISMLLNRQAPVSNMQHQRAHDDSKSSNKPLDFSNNSDRHHSDDSS